MAATVGKPKLPQAVCNGSVSRVPARANHSLRRKNQVVCAVKSFFSSHRHPYNKYAPRRLQWSAGAAGVTLEAPAEAAKTARPAYHGMHHAAVLCSNLERSMEFYQGVLGLELNPNRPDHKLPYRGAWLWIGTEMIHLMELPSPDALTNRPEHGGRDRHFCVGAADLEPLIQRLEAHNIPFTRSMSGRPAIFFRDPDMNCLEVLQTEQWR